MTPLRLEPVALRSRDTFEPRIRYYSPIYPKFAGFLINVCGKAVLMCLNPNLVGVIYDDIMCSKDPL